MRLPVLAVKDLVVFPYLYMPISVGRDLSKRAIYKSINSHKSEILVVLQKESQVDVPSKPGDLFSVGVLCKIVKYDPLSKSSLNKLLVQGFKRVLIKDVQEEKDYISAEYTTIDNLTLDLSIPKNKILYDTLLKDLVDIINRGFISEALIPVKELDNPVATAYLLLSITQKSLDNQKMLEHEDAYDVVNRSYLEILKQKNFLEIKEDLLEKAKENINQNQKEYFLKEQMRTIRKELGEDPESDYDLYLKKYYEIEQYLAKSAKEEVYKVIKRLKTAFAESQEMTVLKTYLDYIFELPWSKKTEDNLNIQEAKKILDNEHYDLLDVKERILEFLSVRKLNPSSKAPIICFSGPPGAGKTSIAKSIATALGRECIRISLGGIKDEAEIRGHRRTYVGAMPGKIMQGLKQAGVVNPIFILDEIDKLSSDFRGDPSSALLEVLDPEQNNTFKDHYLNIEYDLSRVLFIATANNLETIPPALKDRLEVIKLSGYCEEEKIEICKRFIIPKKVKDSGLKEKDLKFSDKVLVDIIRHYTKEFGVREIERQISRLCRKVAKKKAEGSLKKGISLNVKIVREFLGPEVFSSLEDNKNGIGLVTGLAWTPYGGEILKLEAMLIKERGDAILTGRLGEVMVESAKLGVSLIKINAKKWGIDPLILESNRIHIHAPAGAVPKDGPSAGAALVASMVSLLTNKKIKDSIAMTGEVTLTGKVLPVGGIKEKVLAAIRSGIKTVILPKENQGDFEGASEFLANKIEVKYASYISDVLKEIF